MSVKNLLESLTKEKAPGPNPSFQVFHVIKALELISQSAVGRGMVAKKLGIGEGASRTLLERLKRAEIIIITKSGCFLTKRGEGIWKEITSAFPSRIQLEKSRLTLSICNVAILVKNRSDKIKLGIEQRDAAFLAGAKGATTLVMKNGKLKMPDIDANTAKDSPSAYATVLSSLKPNEGDVVVIGSADTWNKAEYGAIAAAWTLFNDSD